MLDDERPPRPTPCQRAAAIVTMALALAVLGGCTAASYVTQAALGQIDLVSRTRPIAEAMRDERTPARIRGLLSQVASIKRFGETRGLRPTKSYTAYADLERAAAVWVVSASQPLRFESKSWWFPFVGSVTYLGWFDLDDAEDFAADLREDGWDVDVREASAYSTLGWFTDPVLSTMIPEGDEALGELADTVLHESLHATLYVEGQSLFNEGVAEFVGRRLATAYLDATVGPDSKEKAAYLSVIDDGEERERLMLAARKKLEDLYSSRVSDAEKRAKKRVILSALREEIGFKRPITNATLAQLETYHGGTAELTELLTACGGDFPRFIAALRAVRPASFAEPQQRDLGRVVTPLARAGCRAGR